jgi:hypothetical protein
LIRRKKCSSRKHEQRADQFRRVVQQVLIRAHLSVEFGEIHKTRMASGVVLRVLLLLVVMVFGLLDQRLLDRTSHLVLSSRREL